MGFDLEIIGLDIKESILHNKLHFNINLAHNILLAVTQCGFDTINMNTTINTLIELKKLQFHIPEQGGKSKCHSLRIGKPNQHCPGMKHCD